MPRSRQNRIDGQFIAHRVELLESAAWASLSLAARKVLDRLEIEMAHHGGKENGNLPCTYADFERHGIRRKSIAPAIGELETAGLLRVTYRGRGGNATFRQPSRYRLTYVGSDATDEWRRFQPPGRKGRSSRDIDSRG